MIISNKVDIRCYKNIAPFGRINGGPLLSHSRVHSYSIFREHRFSLIAIWNYWEKYFFLNLKKKKEFGQDFTLYNSGRHPHYRDSHVDDSSARPPPELRLRPGLWICDESLSRPWLWLPRGLLGPRWGKLLWVLSGRNTRGLLGPCLDKSLWDYWVLWILAVFWDHAEGSHCEVIEW